MCVHSTCVSSWFVFVIVAMPSGLASATDFAGGTGEPNDPYKIAACEQLVSIGSDPNLLDKHFVLVADIDLDPNLPGGQTFTDAAVSAYDGNFNYSPPYNGFTGCFDGNDHVIQNFTLHRTQGRCTGLFGYVSLKGRIRNLHIENAAILGESTVGALVGHNDGTIDNCHASGSVSAQFTMGGLVGNNGFGAITRSSATVDVHGTTGGGSIGGLVGYNMGTIVNCYATGSVTKDGSPSGGGLIGSNFDGTVLNSFWDKQTSGIDKSDGGTGLTPAQMHDIHTFVDAGWDCVDERTNGTADLWSQPEDKGSPELTFWHDTYEPQQLEGSGTPDDPYAIASAEDLGAVCHYNPSAHYLLAADMNVAGITWSAAPVSDFHGVLDGAGFTISGLRIRGGGHLGLFGALGAHAHVTDLGVIDANIVGINHGPCLGMLVGDTKGDIARCYATGVVRAGESACFVGGLAGVASRGAIRQCYATASVSANEGSESLGGLIGLANIVDISNSYAHGTVTAQGDCWAAGGLVAETFESTVTQCYAAVDVPAKLAFLTGGLLGEGWQSTVSGSYFLMLSEGAGPDNGLGDPLSDMEMKQQASFIGWDFNTVWMISEDQDFPRLQWEAGRFKP